MTTLYDRALAFATTAHAGQVRKYTGEPYITHPVAVAEIVRSVAHTENMIAAALLHDVIEDCSVSFGELVNEFGFAVARLVLGLTDQSQPKDGNRAVRKAIDRQWLADQCAMVQTIKLADMIHNTASISEHDPTFWEVYRKEKQLLLSDLMRGDEALWWCAKGQLLR